MKRIYLISSCIIFTHFCQGGVEDIIKKLTIIHNDLEAKLKNDPTLKSFKNAQQENLVSYIRTLNKNNGETYTKDTAQTIKGSLLDLQQKLREKLTVHVEVIDCGHMTLKEAFKPNLSPEINTAIAQLDKDHSLK